MYNILVTCGRGFEKHVIKEIEDKVMYASNITVINEGKVSFKLDTCSSVKLDQDSEVQKNELFTLPDISNMSEQLNNLFNLKLVERLMLLLFYHNFDNLNAQCKIGEGASAVTQVCDSLDWVLINQQVKTLLNANVPSPNVICTCILEVSKNLAVVSKAQTDIASTNIKETMQTSIKSGIGMIDFLSPAVEQICKQIKYQPCKKKHRQNNKEMRHNSDLDDLVIQSKSLSLPLQPTNSEDDSQKPNETNGKTGCNVNVSFPLKVNYKKKMKMEASYSQFVTSTNANNHCSDDVIKPRSEEKIPIDKNIVRFRASCRVTGSWKTAHKATHEKPKQVFSPGSLFNSINKDLCANKMSVDHRRSMDSDDSSRTVLSTTDLYSFDIDSRSSTLGDDQTNMLSAGNPCESSNLYIANTFEQESCSIPAKDTSLSPDDNTKRNKCPSPCPSSSVKIMSHLPSETQDDTYNETKSFSRYLTNTSGTNPFGSSNPILAPLVENVLQHTNWQLDWLQPQVDVYFNLTSLHALLGVSISRTPLSLRPYIPHLSLRSPVCCLMLRAALSGWGCPSPSKSPVQGLQSLNLPTNAQPSTNHENNNHVTPEVKSEKIIPQLDLPYITLLDPMCGAGTILAEAAYSFKVGRVIGCDVSWDQLHLARCNLRSLPADCTASLLRSDAACLPLKSCSVNAVVCDFPFGQKHHEYLANRSVISDTSGCYGSGGLNFKKQEACQKGIRGPNDGDSSCLLHKVLDESARVVVPGGRVVVLVAASMEPQLLNYTGNNITPAGVLSLVSLERLSLGATPGLVCVLQRHTDDQTLS